MLKRSQLVLTCLFVSAAFPSSSLVCLSPVVYAQSISTAQLDGVVKDVTGAIVPGATVTATDTTKGLTRSDKTDSSGHYQLLQLPPGSYSVFSADGRVWADGAERRRADRGGAGDPAVYAVGWERGSEDRSVGVLGDHRDGTVVAVNGRLTSFALPTCRRTDAITSTSR